MQGNTSTFELLEPTSPEVLVPHSRVEPWMLALAAGVFLALVLLLFLKKKSKPSDPVAVREAAFKEAVAGLDAIQAAAPREAAVRSSLIVRKYLSIAAGDPSLFETHEEYVARDKALERFSDEARESASLGFAHLAAIKYSADMPDMETSQVVEGSRKLLDILHGGFKA